METIAKDAVFVVPYPFVREDYVDVEGSKSPSWKPGTRPEQVYDDFDLVADGMGKQVLTIISVHKPGRFPERVFFTRKWIDPDGREFGKGNLRIKTTGNFKQLIMGYGFNVNNYCGLEFEIKSGEAA